MSNRPSDRAIAPRVSGKSSLIMAVARMQQEARERGCNITYISMSYQTYEQMLAEVSRSTCITTEDISLGRNQSIFGMHIVPHHGIPHRVIYALRKHPGPCPCLPCEVRRASINPQVADSKLIVEPSAEHWRRAVLEGCGIASFTPSAEWFEQRAMELAREEHQRPKKSDADNT